MAKVITLGETMVCFSPDSAAPLRYVSSFHPRIAGACLLYTSCVW